MSDAILAKFQTRNSAQSQKYYNSQITANRGQNDRWIKINDMAKRFVPQKLMALFPSVSPVIFIGAYVFIATYAVIVVIVVTAFTIDGVHDLSGGYCVGDTYFYVSTVEFSKDGTFTMDTLTGGFYGRYSKQKGIYYLYPTGGTSDSANPVSDVLEDSTASKYYFTAEKVSDNSLKITMLGKGDYYYYLPWSRKTAIFYKIS